MRFRKMTVAFCFISFLFVQNTVATEDNSAVLDQAHTAMVKHDLSSARKLLLPLAEKGDAPAQNLYGDFCTLTGDEAQAASWYRKAADQGNAKGQNSAGTLTSFIYCGFAGLCRPVCLPA